MSIKEDANSVILKLVDYFFDSKNSLGKRGSWVICILIGILLLNNVSGFTYNYKVRTQLEQVSNIEKLKNEYALSSELLREVNEIELSILNRKTIFEQIFNFEVIANHKVTEDLLYTYKIEELDIVSFFRGLILKVLWILWLCTIYMSGILWLLFIILLWGIRKNINHFNYLVIGSFLLLFCTIPLGGVVLGISNFIFPYYSFMGLYFLVNLICNILFNTMFVLLIIIFLSKISNHIKPGKK